MRRWFPSRRLRLVRLSGQPHGSRCPFYFMFVTLGARTPWQGDTHSLSIYVVFVYHVSYARTIEQFSMTKNLKYQKLKLEQRDG